MSIIDLEEIFFLHFILFIFKILIYCLKNLPREQKKSYFEICRYIYMRRSYRLKINSILKFIKFKFFFPSSVWFLLINLKVHVIYLFIVLKFTLFFLKLVKINKFFQDNQLRKVVSRDLLNKGTAHGTSYFK